MAHICGLNSSFGPTELESLEKKPDCYPDRNMGYLLGQKLGIWACPHPPPCSPSLCPHRWDGLCGPALPLRCMFFSSSTSKPQHHPSVPIHQSFPLLLPPFITWQILIHLFKPTGAVTYSMMRVPTPTWGWIIVLCGWYYVYGCTYYTRCCLLVALTTWITALEARTKQHSPLPPGVTKTTAGPDYKGQQVAGTTLYL